MGTEPGRRDFDCVIVGAGHGGSQAAIALRQNGFKGSIALVGAEDEAPYDRPSLSKDYLAGKKSADTLKLRPVTFWSQHDVELILGHEITSVDISKRTLTSSRARIFGYETAVWAAGGAPRQLQCEGADLPSVYYVRTKADIDRLSERLPTANRVVIIGGGYIGLEVAAVLSERQLEITIVEAAERLLARVAGRDVSDFYEVEHTRRGVKVRNGQQVVKLIGKSGSLSAVELASGEMIHADIVVVGIGIIPNVKPLVEAGASGANGIDVDTLCRTNIPGIYCVGDCAKMHPGPPVRIESIQNAHDQAMTVARSITGSPTPYKATPWFWSNQFDLRLQTVGLNHGYDQTVLRGDPSARKFTVAYLKNGVVVALDCINSPRDYVQGKALVEAKAVVSAELLSDPSVQLKSLAFESSTQLLEARA